MIEPKHSSQSRLGGSGHKSVLAQYDSSFNPVCLVWWSLAALGAAGAKHSRRFHFRVCVWSLAALGAAGAKRSRRFHFRVWSLAALGAASVTLAHTMKPLVWGHFANQDT